jgi:PAS domain S-box-containing protein
MTGNRPAQTHLEALFEASPDAVVLAGSETEILNVNPAFEKLLGYSADELVGQSVEVVFLNESDFQRIWAARHQAAQKFAFQPSTLPYQHKTGREIMCETVAMPTRDADGQITGFMGIVRDVTHEQIKQTVISEADRMYLDALGSSSETAWRLNFKTSEVEIAGPIARSVFGAVGDSISTSVDDWKNRLVGESKLACDQLISGMMKSGRARAELVLNARDGTHVTVIDTGQIIRREADGTPLIAAGLLSDISQRKALEFHRVEADAYLASALEAADLAAWRFDLVNNIARLEGPLTRLVDFDQPSGYITGADWCALVHQNERGDIIRTTMAMAKGETDKANALYRLKDKDGKWRWIHSTGGVTRKDANGRGLVANGIINDVTDTIIIQEQLKAERNRFETIFRSTPAMMHQVNETGTITDVSDFWLSHLGYSRDQVVGRKSTDFLTEESRVFAQTHAFPEFVSTGQARNVPLKFQKQSGEVLDCLMNAVMDETSSAGQRTAYGVITDVTQLRRAYRDLERSNRELDRFATIASHDLQEPLRKISAFAGMLRARYSEQIDADADRCFDYLVDAAARMQNLINDLLEYSQMESRPLRSEELSLKALVEEIETGFSPRIAQSSARIIVEGDDKFRADRFFLNQILQNLISNAIKYRSSKPPEIRISMTTHQSEWSISVSDNGMGFDPKFAEQVFEPFRRLHGRGEFDGAGIGLAIVRQAVDRHNGRISVETRPGEGTSFEITVPNNAPQQRVA